MFKTLKFKIFKNIKNIKLKNKWIKTKKMQVVIVFFSDFKCDCDQNICDIFHIYICIHLFFSFIFLKILNFNILKIF
jgi:hypothetical protein